MANKYNFENSLTDLKSGFIVFLVALPLCLGIALASGVPLISGLVAGIVGGVLVGLVSDSNVSVSGPAAGLVVIMLDALEALQSFELLLVSICLAGALQLFFGSIKLGGLSKWIQTSVIEGMLAAIGVLIILKQIPYALGWIDFKSYSLLLKNGMQLDYNNGALIIGALSIVLTIIYNVWNLKKNIFFKYIPVSVLLVLLGLALGYIFKGTSLALLPQQFVDLGGIINGSQILDSLQFPDFTNALNITVIKFGIIIAMVASIETLLCIQAGDKIDKFKRKTSMNRELIAQGVGNIFSGVLGGLPISSVIVRTSVNIESGAATKLSTVFHGLWLLLGLWFFPLLITQIPLAVLACILIQAGYNLAHPKKIRSMFDEGFVHFIPFVATLIMVVFVDLLMGVLIGQITAVVILYMKNDRLKGSHELH